MSAYNEILDLLIDAAKHPLRQLQTFKARTGRMAVGCFPEYVPAELVYAAGMFPIGLWGGQTEISRAKEYVPAFCCSVLMSGLEYGLNGTYKDLDAVIFPSLCDTLKCLSQNFKVAVPAIKHIQFAHPQMRKIEAGVQFLESEYGRVLSALEELSGTKVSDEAIAEAITVFNANRGALRRFVGLSAAHTDVISPSARHAVIKSGYFMEKPAHTALVNELCDALEALPESKKGKRVLLTGIMADDEAMLRILADCGLAVAADDLAQETRQFRYDVPEEGGAPLCRLAKWWQIFEGCSLAYDPEKTRIGMILDEVEKYGVKGVVVCMMKFCDPEEYDYPLLKQALEDKGIPALYMEIDQNAEAQAQTRIQAFSEII
ncbi:MAG: 2-hydroxyacyl-CoA dehydratase family protein [Oscillospiraceae bacterium]|jgi:bcr-type benzoyl-CoA reductase subunit C|nr:2-hydroxyacyl-CoA dehydratase family protein [Oscillospiraceae bacterium]